jgi:hypothetical protein
MGHGFHSYVAFSHVPEVRRPGSPLDFPLRAVLLQLLIGFSKQQQVLRFPKGFAQTLVMLLSSLRCYDVPVKVAFHQQNAGALPLKNFNDVPHQNWGFKNSHDDLPTRAYPSHIKIVLARIDDVHPQEHLGYQWHDSSPYIPAFMGTRTLKESHIPVTG